MPCQKAIGLINKDQKKICIRPCTTYQKFRRKKKRKVESLLKARAIQPISEVKLYYVNNLCRMPLPLTKLVSQP